MDVLKPTDEVLENYQKAKLIDNNSPIHENQEQENHSGNSNQHLRNNHSFSELIRKHKQAVGILDESDMMDESAPNTTAKKTQKPSKFSVRFHSLESLDDFRILQLCKLELIIEAGIMVKFNFGSSF